MPPMRLTDTEKEMLIGLAQPIPYERRAQFMETVAARLEAAPAIGPGVTHRVARAAQREFFDPPQDLRAGRQGSRA
jgi:hypothetical protein